MDALLSFGNIRQAYRTLRTVNRREDIPLYTGRCAFNTSAMQARGSGLPLQQIARDDRYLIAEIARKTYDPADANLPALTDFMRDRFKKQVSAGRRVITVRELVSSVPKQDKYTTDQLSFSLDEVLDREIQSEDEIANAIEPIREKF
jgi:hypothetical protein